MSEDGVIRECALYSRVSTEDQAREGFSLSEQKARLENFCKYFGYNIKEYYEDAGISAKTGNYRPEFERMLEDGGQGKINMVLLLLWLMIILIQQLLMVKWYQELWLVFPKMKLKEHQKN